MDSATSLAAPTSRERPPGRLSHLGDELLARQAARGSERAFAVLYQRYHQPLYRYCRSILRDDHDAQDALQSAFMGALAALRRSQRNAPLRPWLYRIAHNEAISVLRRRQRDGAREPLAEHVAVASSAEQEVAGRARWRTLVEDLARLPDRQRGALLLRELSGLSHEEIGIALGTTTAAAKQAIFEARQALAEIEEGRAMTCDEVRSRISDGDRRVLRGRRVRAHLRDCAACEAFAVMIPARRAELRAMTPALPSAAAAALLARALGAVPARGGLGTSAATSVGAAGKAASTAVAWKVAASIAVVAGTAAGVADLHHAVTPPHRAAPGWLVPARRGLERAGAGANAVVVPRDLEQAMSRAPRRSARADRAGAAYPLHVVARGATRRFSVPANTLEARPSFHRHRHAGAGHGASGSAGLAHRQHSPTAAGHGPNARTHGSAGATRTSAGSRHASTRAGQAAAGGGQDSTGSGHTSALTGQASAGTGQASGSLNQASNSVPHLSLAPSDRSSPAAAQKTSG